MTEYVSPPIPGARILVVEDETSTRKAIVRALNLMGYQAEEAISGKQAIEKLASLPYDLMLLDLRLPGMDGVEIMELVRETHPTLLVIVLTAHATVESAITAVRSGAADYLLKPCSLREIEAAISRALERRKQRLHRQHLIHIMAEALEALQTEEEQQAATSTIPLERFLQSGPVALDQEKRLVVVSGSCDEGSLDAELTANEVALLAHLMQHPDTVLSSQELARDALGYDVSKREAQDIVRPHISRLRKKIEPDPANPRLIRTIRRKGYYFSPC
jgi:DNA-binding response OmpR family regulator